MRPYSEGSYADDASRTAAFDVAVESSLDPIRRFMSTQIELAGNEAAIDLFLDYRQPEGAEEGDYPLYYEDVPMTVLLPAYVLSELKTAFLIGFQIYLPFVVIDLVTATLLTGMGLVSVSPATVALPCKLLLFVLVDGWFLVVELLLNSVGPFATGYMGLEAGSAAAGAELRTNRNCQQTSDRHGCWNRFRTGSDGAPPRADAACARVGVCLRRGAGDRNDAGAHADPGSDLESRAANRGWRCGVTDVSAMDAGPDFGLHGRFVSVDSDWAIIGLREPLVRCGRLSSPAQVSQVQ